MRYQIRQKIFSIGDRFTIKDEMGNDVYYVKKQILSIGKKLRIFDLNDNEICYIEQKLFRFLPEYNIFIGGEQVANIKKKFTIFKKDFIINSKLGEYHVDGNILGYDFSIFRGGNTVAYISKKFFALSDTYGVEISDEEDQITNLAMAIVIDMVCHDNN